jgi:uncharacterized protein YjbI with pentapeptide repeats
MNVRTIAILVLCFVAAGTVWAAVEENVAGRDALVKDRSCVGCNLRETSLSGLNLTEVDLSGADLRDSNLYLTNFTKANLSGANLSGANLSKASLVGANLENTNLNLANLKDAKVLTLKGALTGTTTICPDGQNGPCNQ